MSRRVTVKTLLVNQRNASPQSLAKHLRYIERDGAGRDGEPGRAYGPQTDHADLDAFKERCGTTDTISVSLFPRKTEPSWTTCAPTPGT